MTVAELIAKLEEFPYDWEVANAGAHLVVTHPFDPDDFDEIEV